MKETPAIDSRLATANVMVTAGIHARMRDDPQFHMEVVIAVTKFEMLDWGDTCQTDAQTNEICLANHDRLFAVYHTSVGKIYIIADAVKNDKPYETITVLFPSEY
jgi:hypothetical protein